jgi:hypothetical protein
MEYPDMYYGIYVFPEEVESNPLNEKNPKSAFNVYRPNLYSLSRRDIFYNSGFSSCRELLLAYMENYIVLQAGPAMRIGDRYKGVFKIQVNRGYDDRLRGFLIEILGHKSGLFRNKSLNLYGDNHATYLEGNIEYFSIPSLSLYLLFICHWTENMLKYTVFQDLLNYWKMNVFDILKGDAYRDMAYSFYALRLLLRRDEPASFNRVPCEHNGVANWIARDIERSYITSFIRFIKEYDLNPKYIHFGINGNALFNDWKEVMDFLQEKEEKHSQSW